ncbi:MAG: YceI family protein [Porticoccaceae bacterium]
MHLPPAIRYRAALLPGVILGLALSLLAGCFGFSAASVERDRALTRPGDYTLDQDHAALLFKVRHMGLAPYVGRFNRFAVELDYDPQQPAETRLRAVIDTASIDVNHADFSRALAGPGWFDSARYPEATFVSTAVTWTDDHHARVTGDFTLLGITAPLTLDAVFHGATRHVITGTYTLGFSGSARLNRSDWGLDNHIPVVDDEVAIEIHVELQRRR